MTHVLTVSNLSKQYGTTTAVDGIGFSVARGEIVGLLGPNGAGKTTTINMILGVLKPSGGSITIDGIDLAQSPSRALAIASFAAVYAPLPGNLTVWENLRVFGLLYDVHQLNSRIETLITEYDLRHLRDTKCGLLSSGEQTRVALAKAMLNQPTLLLLDEPTASLDPATARELRQHIRRLADTGNSGVLWTSHNMAEVEEVCDRVLLLAKGHIVLQGKPQELPGLHGHDSLEDLFIALARPQEHA